MSLATLRLFKAVQIPDKVGALGYTQAKDTNLRTIPKGFVFAPQVLARYPNINGLIDDVNDLYGADPEALNKSFHKSFSKVRDASLRTLYYEQMAHYVSTYGAELRGIYDADRVYIPAERLDAPSIDVSTFELVVIRGLTADELKAALLDFLSTGVALSEQSVKDAVEVAAAVRLTDNEVESVRNREVKIALYDLFNITPADPVEFLRYVVYRLTGDTLLIKNGKAVAAIKEGVTTHNMWPLFHIYDSDHGLDRLGEIFLRYKPLFLALRADKAMRPTINKIRRAAERTHKPMAPDYLNSVTAAIKQGATFKSPTYGGVDLARLRGELENPNVNIFRKIRLAQALRVRTAPDLDSIVYKVRNGKSYATDFTPLSKSQVSDATLAYDTVLMQIANSLAPALRGRSVYIPEGVVYGLPSTEKQFIGNFPTGTYLQVQPHEALVAGVYWENQNGRRVDLDLSLANAGGKIGWDGAYRSGGILFSGDVTDAPHGATEVYWIDPSTEGSWLMSINDYTRGWNGSGEVPYKIVVGTADAKDINRSFTFDPNRLVASAPGVIDTYQQNLGLIVAEREGAHRFYLGMTDLGGGISARFGVNADRALRFAKASLQSAPTFNDVLYYSGAILVDRPEQADEGFDLSPAAIDKTTLLSILTAKVPA